MLGFPSMPSTPPAAKSTPPTSKGTDREGAVLDRRKARARKRDALERTALTAAGEFLGPHGFALRLGMAGVQDMELLAAGGLSRDDLVALFVAAMGADVPIEG